VTATFIGIDLAWQSDRNPTGAVALCERDGRLHLLEAAPSLVGLGTIQEFIARHETERTTVAVDGSLVIPNASGNRRCEREVSSRYGARGASCHATNLTLYPNAGSVRLATWLASRGYAHPGPSAEARVMLEVYPHAAYVALFELPRIIRYKKGRVADKVAGLRVVQQTLAHLPFAHDGVLGELLTCDPASVRGQARKAFEDALDALLCAYLAFYVSAYGMASCDLFGSHAEGYIVNPAVPLSALPERLAQAT
jgi:predicted RNase H-like nuclease